MKSIKSFLVFCLIISCAVKAQEEYSYLWAHQYPALADPQINCCFDFVGDSNDDDLNGSVLLQLEGLLNIDTQEIMDSQIINNELARVWRWDTFPTGEGSSDGPVQMSILEAEVETPGLNLVGRRNGITEIRFNPSPLSVFTGQVTNGHLIMTSESAVGVFYNPFISSFDISQLPYRVEIPLEAMTEKGFHDNKLELVANLIRMNLVVTAFVEAQLLEQILIYLVLLKSVD